MTKVLGTAIAALVGLSVLRSEIGWQVFNAACTFVARELTEVILHAAVA